MGNPLPKTGLALTLAILLALPAAADDRQAEPGEKDRGRPLLVTIDDLPIAGGMHREPEERARITREILAVLARHEIRAVGLVTWGNVRGPEDLDLLEAWLDAGHELGNHSNRHLSYTATSIEEYLADVELSRKEIDAFLAERDAGPLRFFRFPMLREGDTPKKLAAMRQWLDRTGQRNLPVTLDNQDWSFERPWVEAVRADDAEAMRSIGEDYLAALRISVRHHERTGDALFDRPLPQILLLHANAVGAAHWDRLFRELATDHRFADADEVLADPVFDQAHAYVGPWGPSLWDRMADARRREKAFDEIAQLLQAQEQAWNRADLESFVAYYAEDAVFLSTTGVHVGREGILARYRKRYVNPAEMGTLSFDIVDFRPAAGTEVSMLGDARPGGVHGASVAARWHLAYPDREDASGLTLIIFRRTAGGWQIVQDASM